MRKIFTSLLVVVIASCAHGVKYVEPSGTQEVATFDTTLNSSILTFSNGNEGCVSSYSMSSGKLKIFAERETFVRYARQFTGHAQCNILLSFMPVENASYYLENSFEYSESEKSKWLPSAIGGMCQVEIVEMRDGVRKVLKTSIKVHDWKKTLNICGK